MHRLRILLAGALAIGLSACGAPDYVGGTPDVQGLTLETTGTASDGLALSAAPSSTQSALTADGASSAALTPPPPNTCDKASFFCNVQHAVAGLNYFVRVAIEPVQALVSTPPVEKPGDVRVFGPELLPAGNSPVANFRLTVKFVGDDTFRWKLEAQDPANASATWYVVMAGQLRRGDLPHRGRGFIGIDLDKFALVNPTAFTGTGQLLAAFAHVGESKALVFAVHNFKPTASDNVVPAAVFVGHKVNGLARVRIAAYDEFVPPPSGTDAGNELLLSRAGYWPGLGGRAAVVVLGGDVSAYSVTGFNVDAFVGLECFDSSLTDTYRALFVCGTNTTSLTRQCVPDTAWNAANGIGTDPLVDCVSGTDLYDPNQGPGSDPSSTAMEPGAPAAPDAPPSGMPDASF